MAGHVEDRWFNVEVDDNGKPYRVKTDRYGKGMRYRARFVGPDGREQSKSFPDRRKKQAEEWLDALNVDMARGQFVDPKSAKTTFREYAEQ